MTHMLSQGAASMSDYSSMPWQDSEDSPSSSTSSLLEELPDDVMTLISKCCGLSLDKPATSLVVASALPALLTLCTFQVPSLSSRLRRLPFMVLCLVLLACSSLYKLPPAPSNTRGPQLGAYYTAVELNHNASGAGLPSTLAQAAKLQKPTTHTAAALQEEGVAVGSGLSQQAEEAGPAGNDVWPLSSVIVTAVPLFMALLLVQAPAAMRRRHRHSRLGVAAALAVGLLLVLADVEAGASTCAAVKPVCSAKNPFTESIVKPPTASSPTPAAAAPAPARPAVPSPSATDTLLAAMGVRKESFHVASNPESASDVPQRVMPISFTPRISRAVEQQLFTRLLAVLMAPPNTTAQAPAAPPGSSSPTVQLPKPPSTPAVPTPSKPAVPPVSLPPASSDGLIYLSNARLRVGIDPKRGGAITHLSSPILPQQWASANLVNTWDSGRLIQQSYYGCEDGSCWSDRPWRWNPVQGGSWHNYSPKLLSSSSFAGMVSMSAIPRNWGSQQLLDDVVMTTQTRLMPNVVKVRMTMRYTGDHGHPLRHQEVPAVFVDRRLNVLATYTGTKPWTGGQISFLMPGQVGEYYKPTEHWAAYVDTTTGFGVGIYTPISELLVAYRIGPENSTARSDCSYMAPLVTSSIQPQSEFTYDSYIAVGRVDEMRQWFAAIAATVQPNLAAQRRIPTTPPSSSSLPSAGNSSGISFTPVLPSPRTLMMNTTAMLPGNARLQAARLPIKALSGPVQVEPPEMLAPMRVVPTLPLPGQRLSMG